MCDMQEATRIAITRDLSLEFQRASQMPVVAVGTTITDRPPHRSVRARLRIRLLLRMSGVEASVRIGMQDSGRRNRSGQDRRKPIPANLCTLAAAN
jgi:hypothetical protein